MKIKSLSLSLFAAFTLVLSSKAQSTNLTPVLVTGTVTSTNTPTIQDGVEEIVDAIKAGQTNWYFEAHGLYAPSLKEHYGGGLGAFYPLSTYVLTGIRMDYVDGGFWMPSGNATLQVPFTLTSWLTVTPLAYAGIGVPVSGASIGDWSVPGRATDNNGQPTAILGYGAAVKLFGASDNHYHLDLAADRETWTGFQGQQWRLGVVLNWRF